MNKTIFYKQKLATQIYEYNILLSKEIGEAMHPNVKLYVQFSIENAFNV